MTTYKFKDLDEMAGFFEKKAAEHTENLNSPPSRHLSQKWRDGERRAAATLEQVAYVIRNSVIEPEPGSKG